MMEPRAVSFAVKIQLFCRKVEYSSRGSRSNHTKWEAAPQLSPVDTILYHNE